MHVFFHQAALILESGLKYLTNQIKSDHFLEDPFIIYISFTTVQASMFSPVSAHFGSILTWKI